MKSALISETTVDRRIARMLAGARSAEATDAICKLFDEWIAQWNRLNTIDGDAPSWEAENEKLYEIERMMIETPAATAQGILAKLRWIEQELRGYIVDGEPDDIEGMIFSVIEDARRLFSRDEGGSSHQVSHR